MLINGITPERKKPKSAPEFPASPPRRPETNPQFPGEEKAKNKARPTKRQRKVVEIRINRKFEEFTTTEQEKFLNALKALLGMDEDIKILKVSKGSVVLITEVSKRMALKMTIFFHLGKLELLGIDKVDIYGIPIATLDDALAEYLALEPDQPQLNTQEAGVVIFEDTKAGYGIIERDRGGYIKYVIKAGTPADGLGNRKTLGKSRASKPPLTDH